MLKKTSRKVRRFYKNILNIKPNKDWILFVGGLFILFTAIVFVWIASLKIPDFNAFNDRKVANSTKILDRTGEIVLYDIHEDIKRTSVPFEQISQNVKNATIAIEDAEFYNHSGVRVRSTIRAILANILNTEKSQGGSTITQQLVKNTLLVQKKTYTRKIKEWVLAVKMERVLTKDKILELYLNEAPYGGTIYGVEEASKMFFGKSAEDITLAEAAYLAAIPQSPTFLSPYGKNKDKLDNRKNLVLSRMKDLGYIDETTYETTRNEVVEFLPKAVSGIRAPHFVFYIRDYLEEKYGSELVEKGGLRVTTTLDYTLQEEAEKIVKEGALQNEKDFGGSNAALVAIDPQTGQVLSMVGSRDYFDENIDGNFNVVLAKRQPGSSFKPFIYATAFNKGFTQDTVLFDLPTEFQTTCNPYGKALPGYKQSDCYMPDNYDGKFRGPMSLRDALAQSINIPAVKLFYLAGLSDSLKTAEDMGISTLSDINRYGLTLVIGGGEVTLLDITSAYGVFANNGTKNKPTGVLKIENKEGVVLEEYTQNQQVVIPKNTALLISDILSDNQARTPTFGANSSLYVPGYDVAAKTGTTNNNKDAWLVGYSPNIVVGVWAGNNDNKAMIKGGSALAGPLWNKYMAFALKQRPRVDFEYPDTYYEPENVKPVLRGKWQGNENFFIDRISGGLATQFTPKETKEESVITNVRTILHWVDRSNITGPAPRNPEQNAQYRNWNTPIQNWWAQNAFKYRIITPNKKPNYFDNIHTSIPSNSVGLMEPDPNIFYEKNEKVIVELTQNQSFLLKKMDIYLNNVYVGSTKTPRFSFIPDEIENIQQENNLRVVVYDQSFNSIELSSILKIKN
ncbi:MAG: transglycosylase domain-containing protein [Candidatus Paceibacterota bacterium]